MCSMVGGRHTFIHTHTHTHTHDTYLNPAGSLAPTMPLVVSLLLYSSSFLRGKRRRLSARNATRRASARPRCRPLSHNTPRGTQQKTYCKDAGHSTQDTDVSWLPSIPSSLRFNSKAHRVTTHAHVTHIGLHCGPDGFLKRVTRTHTAAHHTREHIFGCAAARTRGATLETLCSGERTLTPTTSGTSHHQYSISRFPKRADACGGKVRRIGSSTLI